MLPRLAPAMPGTPKSEPLRPVPGSWLMDSMIARRVGSLSADTAKRLRSSSGGVMRVFAKRLAGVVALSIGWRSIPDQRCTHLGVHLLGFLYADECTSGPHLSCGTNQRRKHL